MAYLAPSMLSADFSRLAEQIALIEKGGADFIHMDIMDGCFVPNITFGAPVAKSLVGKTGLPFDIHFMTVHPEERIADFITPQTEYMVVHQEACIHLNRVVNQIREFGVKPGVAINPGTPVCILDSILEYVDLVLVMSVNPGFGGQKFIPNSMDKIRALAKLREERGLDFMIEVDGGVSLSNAAELKAAGADIFVAGSAVYGADNVPKRCREFLDILKEPAV